VVLVVDAFLEVELGGDGAGGVGRFDGGVYLFLLLIHILEGLWDVCS